MKFIYKVWSNYDGFTPSEIPRRRLPGGALRLGWRHYIESVERDSEIWVYFHGRHRFENGVYIKGVPDEVDIDAREVLLRVREYSTDEPLTDDETSALVAEVVRARGLQVFLLPEFLDVAPECDVATAATSCQSRRCGSCPTWKALPVIRERNLGWPAHLSGDVEGFAPGYWVIPPRNFIHQRGQTFKDRYRRTSELFKRFKTGERRLAFPLALGMHEALAARELEDVECVVPVPLSPDKEEAGEIHRTRLLATELARLLGVQRRELLTLSSPISKRTFRGQRGFSAAQFEWAYARRLLVRDAVERYERILLVDDVCTEGSTLSACLTKLWEVNAELEVVVASAGQMAVRAAVRREEDLASS